MTLLNDSRKAYDIWKRLGWKVLRQKIGRRISGGDGSSDYRHEAMIFATWMDFSQADINTSRKLHEIYAGNLDIGSITWFLPEFENPYYGGIYTLLRFADYFKRNRGIQNHFAILGNIDDQKLAGKIAEAFPSLAGDPVRHFTLYEHIKDLEATDAGIATLWGTAYFLLRYNQTKRKFYFIQDYEPLFYPAGSIFAQVEASLRFGYYGIANTPTIRQIYRQQYGGQAEYFYPCVDTHIFHPAPANSQPQPETFTVFFYGRPNHPRNGFELGAQALRILKRKLGDRVRIVAAGARWDVKDYSLNGVVENLGLLSYQQTAELYRGCHAGLVMMFTRHPSYLPFELMASGSLVVTNYNPATTWFLKDGQNCRLAEVSATSIADVLEQALLDHEGRQRITHTAADQIRTDFSDWGRQIEKIYAYMCNPITPAS
jgi:glycosyltransferase involved in cell wall biosynthesis